MNQSTIEEKNWIKDEELPNVEEWIKLAVGETIEGKLLKKHLDNKYMKMKYIFEKAVVNRNDGTAEIYETAGINGTSNMDFKMEKKQEGDFLKLERIEDKDLDKPNPLQQYITYHLEDGGD